MFIYDILNELEESANYGVAPLAYVALNCGR